MIKPKLKLAFYIFFNYYYYLFGNFIYKYNITNNLYDRDNTLKNIKYKNIFIWKEKSVKWGIQT